MGSMGFVMPNTAVGALSRHAAQAASASALMGTMQFCMAAVSGVLVGYLGDGTARALAEGPKTGAFSALAMACSGVLTALLAPLVLAMTFGLSMDYEIFLLTRIRERFLQTGNTRDAVAYGVSTSARTITSAALIMIAVFGSFAFDPDPIVQSIGFALAVGVIIDAFVVRMTVANQADRIEREAEERQTSRLL